MQVYPNPVKNHTINVQLNNLPAGNYSFTIYAAGGQRVIAGTLNHPGGNAGIAVNVQSLAKGVYWIVLQGNKTSSKKMILVQ